VAARNCAFIFSSSHVTPRWGFVINMASRYKHCTPSGVQSNCFIQNRNLSAKSSCVSRVRQFQPAPTGQHAIAKGNALVMHISKSFLAPSERHRIAQCENISTRIDLVKRSSPCLCRPFGVFKNLMAHNFQGVALRFHIPPLRGFASTSRRTAIIAPKISTSPLSFCFLIPRGMTCL